MNNNLDICPAVDISDNKITVIINGDKNTYMAIKLSVEEALDFRNKLDANIFSLSKIIEYKNSKNT